MCSRTMATLQKLAHRVAEESQLLAEEKWIIDTLNQIKKQRNCLQIERLQLESMKNQMTFLGNKTSKDKNLVAAPVTKMQNTSEAKPIVTSISEEQFLEAEALCNKEELDLNVTNSIFNRITTADINMEEDEEDEEDDNYEDILIDMNMFMHGMQGAHTKPEK